MAESVYLRYAYLKLIEEGKYTWLNPLKKKIKVFDPMDIWRKIFEFDDIVKKDRKQNRG